LAAGGDANAALLSGETPLMEAARRGNVETVRALLAGGANPNAQEGNGGQTALMWAISERQASVAEALLRGGADVKLRSKRGSTALMFAAQQKDVSYARMLLAAGANPNDQMPRTAQTPLIIASAMGHGEVAALLLDNKADPNAVDGNGYASLHHAVRDKSAVGIVKALIAHGAKPNVRIVQQKPVSTTTTGIFLRGATPLAVAAEINNFDAVKVLVEGGADPLIPTESNSTPLMLAAGAGTDVVRPRGARERQVAIQTVKYLVERGAGINDVGQFGWTPLHAAAYQGLNDVIEFLVSKGAKLETMDEFGQTPLSISLSVLTRKIGAATLQIPRILRKDTATLLLKLGATPLDQSGVDVLMQRNAG
jgi:cytohesin